VDFHLMPTSSFSFCIQTIPDIAMPLAAPAKKLALAVLTASYQQGLSDLFVYFWVLVVSKGQQLALSKDCRSLSGEKDSL